MHVLRFTALMGLATAATINLRQTGQSTCVDAPIRIEWRELTPDVQQNYIESVLCMKTKPSRIGLSTSLYDDFPYVHQKYNKIIHGLASFLPWHRYFVQVYEDALRECGYNGVATYWDWTLDVMRFSESPVLSSTLGFGYTGSATRTEVISPAGYTINCVDSGPFSNLTVSYYGLSTKQYQQQEHCLSRNIIDGTDNDQAKFYATWYNGTNVSNVQKQQPFSVYRMGLENFPHAAIHNSIGGDMGPQTSPNEPLFFLHHTQVDRLWTKWQQEDLSRREFDYSGPILNSQNQIVNATLDDMLVMGGLAEDLRVRDVMSTNGRLCYKYAN